MSKSETIEIETEPVAEDPATIEEVAESEDSGGDSVAEEDSVDPAGSQEEALRAELESVHKELEGVRDTLLRARAEFENIRKRLEKEKQFVIRYAAFDTIKSLLAVVDDVEKAIGSEHVSDEVKKGLEQILQKMFGVFEKAGLREVDQNETFDPHLHEALARAPATDGQSDQQVLEVWRKGYLFKDRLMRAAWVKVAVEE